MRTLIERLDDFERDPEKCSPSYHVKLQFQDRGATGLAAHPHQLIAALSLSQIEDLVQSIMDRDVARNTGARLGKVGRYHNPGNIVEALLHRYLALSAQSLRDSDEFGKPQENEIVQRLS